MALALALGFGDTLAQRGRLVCNLLVLDEVSMMSSLCLNNQIMSVVQ